MNALIEQLRTEGPRLSAQVIAKMYENPFWAERFGDRGRTHANQDGDFHIRYLVEALSAQDRGVMTRYANWLRNVLTTRGMCSRHLADNFELLAQAVSALPNSGEAVAYLSAASTSLRYESGTARELQLCTQAVVRDVIDAIASEHPDWVSKPRAKDRCEDDVRYHLSYLEDALALGTHRHFVAYAQFIDRFLQRRKIPGEHLRTTLRLLNDAISRRGEALAAACAPLLSQAISSIG